MRDYKPRAIVFLMAAIGVTHYNRESMLAWVQATGISIHLKTIAAAESKAGIPGTTKFVGHDERWPNLLSFYLYSKHEEADASAHAKIVCVTETKGYRLPFTNVAYASSSAACSVGDYAADMRRTLDQGGYSFLY